MDDLTMMLRTATRVVVMTGAGVSTDSGIPDFRGPQGAWTLDPTAERLTDWPSYRDDEVIRRRSWRWRVSNPALRAMPNGTHRALATLGGSGRMTALVTQNVDGLHLAAGTPDGLVHELHGSLREVLCPGCGWRAPMAWAVERVEAGDSDPRCPDCTGITKAATVFFGEPMPEAAMRGAVGAARACDLFIAIGTTLTVNPAAALPAIAQNNGARLAIVNAEPTPMDDDADLVVREPIGDVVPTAIAAALAG